MKLYNINANLIKVIESLYSKATSAVCYNGSVGEWFRTTVAVRQDVCFHLLFLTSSSRES